MTRHFCVFVILLEYLVQSDASCACGVESAAPRIVGGTPSQQNRYPWMVGVLVNSWCGGALINDRYVLTAAHCVDKPQGESRVTLGVHSFTEMRDREATGKSSYSVEEIIIHEKYNRENLTADIALLKLSQPISKFTNTVRPVCLPPRDMVNMDNSTLKAIGWGYLQDTPALVKADVLMEVFPPPREDEICGNYWSKKFNLTVQLCAGTKNKKICGGDSGGPLLTIRDGVNYQVGITSFGSNDCGDWYPDVYTRVVGYLEWIEKKTKGAVYCN